MRAYRFETHIQQNGTLIVDNVPLRAGEAVEVIILVRPAVSQELLYPLRGLPVHYDQPTEPVATRDWDVA